MENLVLSVGEFVALTNQTLEFAYPLVKIEGEVSSFNVNQGKFVFFDLKDDEAQIGCFMMVFQLNTPIEDGMKVVVTATPKLTNKGRFSLTIKQIEPAGEGDIKRSFELLKSKLIAEGLFDDSRKRRLPEYPAKVAVVSSEDAAGYGDFIKIVNQRWGGVELSLAHVQVQGDNAVEQIVGAINFINQLAEFEVLVLVRGGGSAEDLMAFNSEPVVRAIAGSKTPILVGVGHETDVTLAGMAADYRASTPTDAATVLVPNREEELSRLNQLKSQLLQMTISREGFNLKRERLHRSIIRHSENVSNRLELIDSFRKSLKLLHPQSVLNRGFAIARVNGATLTDSTKVKKGDRVMLQLRKGELNTVVED